MRTSVRLEHEIIESLCKKTKQYTMGKRGKSCRNCGSESFGLNCSGCSYVTCRKCLKAYKHDEFNAHLLKSHEFFACVNEQCDQVFPQKKNMQRHNDEVHLKKKWRCPYPGCFEDIGAKRSLESHLLSKHDLETRTKMDGGKYILKPEVVEHLKQNFKYLANY